MCRCAEQFGPHRLELLAQKPLAAFTMLATRALDAARADALAPKEAIKVALAQFLRVFVVVEPPEFIPRRVVELMERQEQFVGPDSIDTVLLENASDVGQQDDLLLDIVTVEPQRDGTSSSAVAERVGDLDQRTPVVGGAAQQRHLHVLQTTKVGGPLRDRPPDDGERRIVRHKLWLLMLRRRGIAVLFIHHAGTNGRQRGTSRREDALDTVIALRRPEDYSPEQGARFEIHFEKLRNRVDGAGAVPFEASLESFTGDERDGIRWCSRDLVAPILKRAAALFTDGLTVREVAAILRVSKSEAGRLRLKALEEGLLMSDEGPEPNKHQITVQ